MLAALTSLKVDPANFATEFDAWKASGEAGEFSNYLFGKDGAYIAPKVGGQANVLRHVHLVPLKDPDKLRGPKKQRSRVSLRKRSNTWTSAHPDLGRA